MEYFKWNTEGNKTSEETWMWKYLNVIVNAENWFCEQGLIVYSRKSNTVFDLFFRKAVFMAENKVKELTLSEYLLSDWYFDIHYHIYFLWW